MEASFGDFSFIQKEARLHRVAHKKVAPPVLPETPTTYVKQESGGVLGLMNQMKEDLTADMTEAETEEKFSASDYVRIMKEAKETRAQLTKSKQHKLDVKAETEQRIA